MNTFNKTIRNVAAFLAATFFLGVIEFGLIKELNSLIDQKAMAKAEVLADEMYAARSQAEIECLGHKYADALLAQGVIFKQDGEAVLGFDEPQYLIDNHKYVETNMVVEATAYWTMDPVEASGDGIAYDGTRAIEYQTIAVDPSVIPLQSEVYIPQIGWCRCNDTGNAIKGKIIDIAMPSREKAFEWGRRICYVKVRMPRKEK